MKFSFNRKGLNYWPPYIRQS